MNALESLACLRYIFRRPSVRWSGVGMAVLITLCLAVAFGIWWPATEQIASLERRITVSRKRVVAAAQLKAAKTTYQQTIKALERLETKLAADASQADLIDQVSKLASKYKLKVLSESYGEEQQVGSFGSLNQELILLASYKSLRRFISGLHSLPTWTVVESVQIERAPQKRELVKVNLRIATKYRLIVADTSER